MVVDETGDKMSKVKGNVIDPLDLVYGSDFKEVVAKALPGAPEAEALAKFKKAYPSAAQMGAGFPAFGADALRYTLATFPPSNKRIALAPKRIEGYRHFVNKILERDAAVARPPRRLRTRAGTAPRARRIRTTAGSSRASRARSSRRTPGFKEFRIDEAANELYRFFWNDFCDWYLEIAKTVLRDADDSLPIVRETKATLAHVLETSLRALHPLMPYVTEELWQRFPKGGRASRVDRARRSTRRRTTPTSTWRSRSGWRSSRPSSARRARSGASTR